MSNKKEVRTKKEGKAPLSYLYKSFLDSVGYVREYGAQKHENYNTWKDHPIEELCDATMRHVSAMCDMINNPESKESLYDESGNLHAAMAACNLMYIVETLYRKGYDIRLNTAVEKN